MLLTAFFLGLAGSLHCVGMCSPLIMAVTSQKPIIARKLLYNTGRIFTYGVLGSSAATVGMFIQLTAYQQILSFLIGGILLLIGIGGISGVKIPFVSTYIIHFTSWLKRKFGSVLQRKNSWSSVILGMLNGLLPCGLTYLALAYCLSFSTWWEGFVFMFFFGLGTWPVMLGVTSLLGLSPIFFKHHIGRATTILFVLSGCLLIGRAIFTHDHANDQNKQFVKSEVLCR